MIKNYYLSDFSEVLADDPSEQHILVAALNKVQKEIDEKKIEINCGEFETNSNRPIIGMYQNKLHTQGLVGAIKTNVSLENGESYKVNIVIKSRFDEQMDKPYFLAKMLESTDLDIASQFSDSSYEDLFEFLLVGLFRTRLSNALNIGTFKKYVRYDSISSKPKGNIDIPKYIKARYDGRAGEIPYSYSERTVDNYINQLIVATYYSLKRSFPRRVEEIIDNSELKSDIARLISEIHIEKDVRRILAETNRPLSHPFYSAYEDLRQICHKILRYEGISPFDQDDSESEALLYYIPDLWEGYLQNKLFGYLNFLNVDIKAQERLKVVDNLNIRPDFVFVQKDNSKPLAIFDAKFKPSWGRNEFDLDDYTKCVRDMNAFDTHITGVVFPSKSESAPVLRKNRVSSYNQSDTFIRISIHVPDVGKLKYHSYSSIIDERAAAAALEIKNGLQLI